MDDTTTPIDRSRQQTINPLMDEISRRVEPLLKTAMVEFGFELPLAFRIYNQIRFYEETGKLKLSTSVASKDTLAKQFNVTVKQVEQAFNNLTNKYKLGKWVDHNEPVFRSVSRTWMSNERLKISASNYYAVTPELLQRNSTTITVEQLASGVRPLSESKGKLSESKNISTGVLIGDESPKVYGKPELNELFDYWESSTGIKIQARLRANRNACNNIFRRYGLEKTKLLVDGVALAQNTPFAPQISDFSELQDKLTKLLTWGKTNQLKGNSVVVIS